MELNIDLSKNIASAAIWSYLLFKTKLICKTQRKSVAPIVEFCFAFLFVCFHKVIIAVLCGALSVINNV